MRALCITLALVACGTSPTSPTDATDAGKKDSAVLVDAGSAAVELSGAIIDMKGNPWPLARVLVCGSLPPCDVSFSNVAGAWSMRTSPEAKVLRIEGEANDGRFWSPVVRPVDLIRDLAISPPIVLPETPAPQPLTNLAQPITSGEITVTLDPAKLVLPATVAASAFAAVRVPQTAWPPYDAGGRTILAMWAFNPYGTRSIDPIAVTIDNVQANLALAPNETVTILSVDPSTGLLVEPATATLAVAKIITDNGQGLRRLTWMVVAK